MFSHQRALCHNACDKPIYTSTTVSTRARPPRQDCDNNAAARRRVARCSVLGTCQPHGETAAAAAAQHHMLRYYHSVCFFAGIILCMVSMWALDRNEPGGADNTGSTESIVAVLIVVNVSRRFVFRKLFKSTRRTLNGKSADIFY